MPDEPHPEGPDDLESPPDFFPRERPEGAEGEADELVEVEIEGVYQAESEGQVSRFVLLSDGERKLPILIGPYEATAITYPLENARPDRPMTHDLVRAMLDRLDVGLDRVVIDDLWNATYYAKLYLLKGKEEIEVDARPSDALALAVRFDAPIYVADGILESAMD